VYLCGAKKTNMKFKLPIILAALMLFSGCVDKAYNIDDLKMEGRIFKDIEIPVGNFKEILLADMDVDLSQEHQDIFGIYHISLSTDIHGLDFDFGNTLSFEEAELHTSIANTIPLDMAVTAFPIDAEGYLVSDVNISIESAKDPTISAGSIGSPSTNNVVLKVTCNGTLKMEGIRFVMTGQTGKGHEWEDLQEEQGFKMNNVYLKIPKGFQISM